MNIQDAIIEKTLLERRLQSFIVEQLAKFEADTGLTPSSITVEMLDVTVMADFRPNTKAGRVTLDFRL
ncbi:MAG: hypothetical protein DRQ40_03890 [Gammaproteobacteria bacterium]|nr:MAG: hypothetical protein DRQ40_03890 [Gammaproteobacteria bacterium]